ncbi:MAG: helix-turn-helix domain-containing protein [Eubacteriales bacterium]|nr:helix-turn-helix domain-containing protein [Eubacteriales bacterium]
MKEEMISTAELCKFLKVCKTTVFNWREQGMPYYGKDKSLRYLKSEVMKWLSDQNSKKKKK